MLRRQVAVSLQKSKQEVSEVGAGQQVAVEMERNLFFRFLGSNVNKTWLILIICCRSEWRKLLW